MAAGRQGVQIGRMGNGRDLLPPMDSPKGDYVGGGAAGVIGAGDEVAVRDKGGGKCVLFCSNAWLLNPRRGTLRYMAHADMLEAR